MKSISTIFYNLTAIALLAFGSLCVIGAAFLPAGIIYGPQQKWFWFSILAMLVAMLFSILIYYRITGKIKSFLSPVFFFLLGGIFALILELFMYLLKAARKVRASNPTRPSLQGVGSALALVGVLLFTFSLFAIILAVNAKDMRGFWVDYSGLWNLMILAGVGSTLAGVTSLNGDMRLNVKM